MTGRLHSRYRRKHDGFLAEVRVHGGLFLAVIPTTSQSKLFTTATAAATAASKSAQAGRPAWPTKQQ